MAKPILQALLIADQIYRDASTGKWVICGVFGRVFVRTAVIPTRNATASDDASDATPVPIDHLRQAGSPSSYISLTEVQGLKRMELRFVDLLDNRVLFSTEFQIESNDPLASVEIAIPLPPLPVAREGTYALELLCDDELLGSHRVRAELLPTTTG